MIQSASRRIIVFMIMFTNRVYQPEAIQIKAFQASAYIIPFSIGWHHMCLFKARSFFRLQLAANSLQPLSAHLFESGIITILRRSQSLIG